MMRSLVLMFLVLMSGTREKGDTRGLSRKMRGGEIHTIGFRNLILNTLISNPFFICMTAVRAQSFAMNPAPRVLQQMQPPPEQYGRPRSFFSSFGEQNRKKSRDITEMDVDQLKMALEKISVDDGHNKVSTQNTYP